MIVLAERDPIEREIVATKFGYVNDASSPHRSKDGVPVWYFDDVWQTVSAYAAGVVGFLRAAPPNHLILVVAGSPCQDLTSIHKDGGRLGLVGGRSVNFHVIPLLLYFLARAFPKALIVPLIENAGSMLPRFRDYILDALGMADGQVHQVNAGQFAMARRSRLFFSPLAPDRNAPPARQKAPWEGPWRYLGTPGTYPPWMTFARLSPGKKAVPSVILFYPDNLLVKNGTGSEDMWAGLPPALRPLAISSRGLHWTPGSLTRSRGGRPPAASANS